MGRRHAGTATMARAGRQDPWHSWIWPHRRSAGSPCKGFRYAGVRRRQAQSDIPVGVSFIGGPERLDDVLRQADYLAITLSLSAETRGLLDERALRLMKPAAYLINVARAEILDEVALYRTLANSGIAGAALDAWYRYPKAAGPTLPATQPFHELGNVIMTPHVSGWTEGMLDARATLIASNIERIARGESTLNAIDPVS